MPKEKRRDFTYDPLLEKSRKQMKLLFRNEKIVKMPEALRTQMNRTRNGAEIQWTGRSIKVWRSDNGHNPFLEQKVSTVTEDLGKFVRIRYVINGKGLTYKVSKADIYLTNPRVVYGKAKVMITAGAAAPGKILVKVVHTKRTSFKKRKESDPSFYEEVPLWNLCWPDASHYPKCYRGRNYVRSASALRFPTLSKGRKTCLSTSAPTD